MLYIIFGSNIIPTLFLCGTSHIHFAGHIGPLKLQFVHTCNTAENINSFLCIQFATRRIGWKSSFSTPPSFVEVNVHDGCSFTMFPVQPKCKTVMTGWMITKDSGMLTNLHFSKTHSLHFAIYHSIHIIGADEFFALEGISELANLWLPSFTLFTICHCRTMDNSSILMRAVPTIIIFSHRYHLIRWTHIVTNSRWEIRWPRFGPVQFC